MAELDGLKQSHHEARAGLRFLQQYEEAILWETLEMAGELAQCSRDDQLGTRDTAILRCGEALALGGGAVTLHSGDGPVRRAVFSRGMPGFTSRDFPSLPA